MLEQLLFGGGYIYIYIYIYVCVCVCVCIQRHSNPEYYSSNVHAIGNISVLNSCLVIVNGLQLLHNWGFCHLLTFCIVTQGEEITILQSLQFLEGF